MSGIYEASEQLLDTAELFNFKQFSVNGHNYGT